MGPNSDTGKGTLYINGEPLAEVGEIKISLEVEPSDLPPILANVSFTILSNETIVAQHPWTTDVELELERIRKEKEEAMEQAQDYTGAFGNVQKEDPDGDEGGDE